MSDWEIVENNNSPNKSEWEQVSDIKSNIPKESLGSSIVKAPFRIGEDIARGLYGLAKNIPSYYEAAKTEIPGAFTTLYQDPKHGLGQFTAGIAEAGKNTFNLPHDIVNYLSSGRLNLIPSDINEKVQMARMPNDTQEMINQTFGGPIYPGESLLRGAARNIFNIGAGGKASSVLNPLNLTYGNIAKNILKEGNYQKQIYGEKYKKFFKEAEKKGLNDALYDVNIDFNTIKKYSPKNKIEGLTDFFKNPTLESAHFAKSDLSKLQRKLDNQPTLNTAERKQYKAITDAINELKSNMFKGKNGKIDEKLLEKYNKIQQGYSNDLLPYKNKNITRFNRNEISDKELVKLLSQGEFSAKRGLSHPAMKIRSKLPLAAGLIGTGSIAYPIYNRISNNSSEK